CVNVQEFNAGERHGSAHRARHSVWDVVVFQIQEDFGAEVGKFPEGFRSRCGKELLAHLEHAHAGGQQPGHAAGIVEAVKVQGDDYSPLCFGVQCPVGTWRSSMRTRATPLSSIPSWAAARKDRSSSRPGK